MIERPLRIYKYRAAIIKDTKKLWGGCVEVQAHNFVTAQGKVIQLIERRPEYDGDARFEVEFETSINAKVVDKNWKEGVQ